LFTQENWIKMTRTATTAVALHPLLAERWSPRAFDPTVELSDAELAAVLEAARWAPSAMNRQPWRYLVGRRGDTTFKAVYDSLAEGNQLWAHNAAALVVATTRTLGPDGTADALAPYELGLSVAQLIAQAHAEGLYAHQMGGFSPDHIQAELGVPDDFTAVVVIALGRIGAADELPEPLRLREVAARSRQPLGEIAFAGSWGEPVLGEPTDLDSIAA